MKNEFNIIPIRKRLLLIVSHESTTLETRDMGTGYMGTSPAIKSFGG